MNGKNALTEIPFIVRIIAFASKNVQAPLQFSQVSSSWSEAVRDYSALSLVWRNLMDEYQVSFGEYHKVRKLWHEETEKNTTKTGRITDSICVRTAYVEAEEKFDKKKNSIIEILRRVITIKRKT